MSGLCLIAGVLIAPLGETVTLIWTHSIEKTQWEEEWRQEGEGVRAVEARVRTTGAGMEPPAGARWEKGEWRYVPALPPLPRLLLRHSPYAADYLLCASGRCQPPRGWLPGLPAEGVLEIAPCPPTS